MAVQIIVVVVVVLSALVLREVLLYHDHMRAIREDREVAELEALYAMDWEWPSNA